MRVQELIEHLTKMNPDHEIVLHTTVQVTEEDVGSIFVESPISMVGFGQTNLVAIIGEFVK